MGWLGAAMGFGLIFGPAAGGWLGSDSLALPFFIAAGSSLLALVLAALWLPESLSAEARQQTGKVRTIMEIASRKHPSTRNMNRMIA